MFHYYDDVASGEVSKNDVTAESTVNHQRPAFYNSQSTMIRNIRLWTKNFFSSITRVRVTSLRSRISSGVKLTMPKR